MRKQLATLAFTAALAAALTLFGCKEEKAKTPEAAADTVPQAEETAEAEVAAQETPQAEVVNDLTYEEALADASLFIRASSYSTEISTSSVSWYASKIDGLTLKVDGKPVTIETDSYENEEEGTVYFAYSADFKTIPENTYTLEVTAENPKVNAALKFTVPSSVEFLKPSDVKDGNFDVKWNYTLAPENAPRYVKIDINTYNDNSESPESVTKYANASLKKYTVTKDMYNDEYSAISLRGVTLYSLNLTVSDKVAFSIINNNGNIGYDPLYKYWDHD